MKAINLIPAEQRRGAGGAAGRSGGAAYVVVGVLAVALLIFGSWTLTNKQIKDKQAEAASVTQQAQIRGAQAAALGPYTKFAELRANRVQTVKQLANSRFDWAHAMGELSRTIPPNTWLTAITGTTAPGVGSDVGGAANPLRTSLAVPALELTGCSTSQIGVTTLLTRLRLMNGVQRVSLSNSTSNPGSGDSTVSGQTDSADGSDGPVREDPCTAKRPSFNAVVFYEGLITPPGQTGKPEVGGTAPTSTTGAATTPGATTTTTTPGTTTSQATTQTNGGTQ